MSKRTAQLLIIVTMLLALGVGLLAPTASARGNPHETTTTTATAPRTPTMLTVHPVVPVAIAGCTPVYACPWFTSWSVLSSRLTTEAGVPIEGRTVSMRAGSTSWGSCYGVTDATGLARCVAVQPNMEAVTATKATAWFGGDSTYAPSSGQFGA